MNILYSAKERQKYGEKTAPKYNPLSQLLLGCSAVEAWWQFKEFGGITSGNQIISNAWSLNS